MRTSLLLIYILTSGIIGNASALDSRRWTIINDGAIVWKIDERIPHHDHIEMSGLEVSTVVRYGVDAEGAFHLNRGMVWPMLRTLPNNTHASLMRRISGDPVKDVLIDGRTLENEKVDSIKLDGVMTVYSNFLTHRGAVGVLRTLLPSYSKPAFCEEYMITNNSERELTVEIPYKEQRYVTDRSAGLYGSYEILIATYGAGTYKLKPTESITFSCSVEGLRSGEKGAKIVLSEELNARRNLINQLQDNLVLESPDSVINSMFAFAKIRGCESIHNTKGGLMHGPGGESYYAAIWANDQAEYINPFFPFVGYEVGNESAINSFRHFAKFMNPKYKPIPSSIIAEGDGIWQGAGDRGDGAMIAYGAGRYALARADRAEAEELWELIEWCLEFCRRKTNKQGAIMSDSDELEGRFPSGEANLCTSSLYYDALVSAVCLGKELGKPNQQLKVYEREIKRMRNVIENYFGADVEGFRTYQYYEGNEILRSWICIPLTVGIYDRARGTGDALLSPRLWTDDGLLTEAGSKTFWDRSTLYALRGLFAAGDVDRAGDYLKKYSTRRLLGEHVPYAIEAWPEGSQRHLSAESGLYCRIIIEGIFGIRPVGFNKFEITPNMPSDWNKMALRKIRAFQRSFDVEVDKQGDWQIITIINNESGKTTSYSAKLGETTQIDMIDTE